MIISLNVTCSPHDIDAFVLSIGVKQQSLQMTPNVNVVHRMKIQFII
jgi:hypothetical protein